MCVCVYINIHISRLVIFIGDRTKSDSQSRWSLDIPINVIFFLGNSERSSLESNLCASGFSEGVDLTPSFHLNPCMLISQCLSNTSITYVFKTRDILFIVGDTWSRKQEMGKSVQILPGTSLHNTAINQ